MKLTFYNYPRLKEAAKEVAFQKFSAKVQSKYTHVKCIPIEKL